ncbi:MAG: type II toxin-antitoxin system RelE/ParE family toxin [Candidatus Omnitrophica bacterium]|nr:type II toxin-antitoxin system RelE/ParE family toxin [Candidatus Omnitrophota bacterium]
MPRCQCVYFQTGSGRAPAKEFIDSLDVRSQQKYFAVTGLLSEFGQRLPQPHAKRLDGGIYELRFRGIEGHVRVLYFFYHQHKAVFTNGFIKKSGLVPVKKIQTAKKRKKVYLQRCEPAE